MRAIRTITTNAPCVAPEPLNRSDIVPPGVPSERRLLADAICGCNVQSMKFTVAIYADPLVFRLKAGRRRLQGIDYIGAGSVDLELRLRLVEAGN